MENTLKQIVLEWLCVQPIKISAHLAAFSNSNQALLCVGLMYFTYPPHKNSVALNLLQPGKSYVKSQITLKKHNLCNCIRDMRSHIGLMCYIKIGLTKTLCKDINCWFMLELYVSSGTDISPYIRTKLSQKEVMRWKQGKHNKITNFRMALCPTYQNFSSFGNLFEFYPSFLMFWAYVFYISSSQKLCCSPPAAAREELCKMHIFPLTMQDT